MNLLFAIQLAGALHLLVAAANFVSPRVLHYDENLAKMSPIMRQIFLVHAFYIVLVLVGIGMACLFFPHDLSGATQLGKYLSAFLAIFWSLRVMIQLGYYDRATKAQFRLGHLVFTGIFLYFALTFIAATVHCL